MKKIYVENNKKNIKLVNYILNNFPKLSPSFLYKALRNKDIKINGKRVSKDISLETGDILEIYISDDILYNVPKKIDVIYEDENLLVVFKPQGVLTNKAIGNLNINDKVINNELSLEELVKQTYSSAELCHRLDRNTSGLVIFTLNDLAYNEILLAFKTGLISKEYITYVSGCNFKKNKDTLTNYILKDSANGFCKIYDKNILGSKKIITDYEVLYKNTDLDYSVLKVIIHTGKTHQIRAQMLDISHPIIR